MFSFLRYFHLHHSKEQYCSHIDSIYLIKKDEHKDRRDILLNGDVSSLIKISNKEVFKIKKIIKHSPCKRNVKFIPAAQGQYFALINDKNQIKDYLWITSSIMYYPKISRYFIIEDKQDKLWMEYFLTKYDNLLQ